MEPLTVAVLSRLTPARFDRAFFDDRIEAVDYDVATDIVALVVETYTAKRAYTIAERFRARGKLVVMGGYHATLLPEEVRQHCDILVRGNAESVWAQLLADVEDGCWQREYAGAPRMDYGLPDRSIYAAQQRHYLPVSLVETGRGCRHCCEFCSIYAYYKQCYYHRSVEEILAEIKSCRHRLFFFVDDSIFSDRAFAKALFAQVAKLDILWTTQVTLDVARDEELLRLMKQSGCEMILIGFESIDPQNLAQMNKAWNAKLGERDALVERIHRNGIGIYASFVFGFDYDEPRSFDAHLAFCRRHDFFITAFNHLLAFPGTPLYARFEREGRLYCADWWQSEGYAFGTISFHPRRLSREELRALCRRSKEAFFAFPSILRRWLTLLKRTRRPRIHLAFWIVNVLLHFEVDKRLGIPVGENLDEAVK